MLAVVVLFGWGCAHFDPKPLDVAKTASDFDQRRLDAPELRAFLETNLSPVAAWPLPQWTFEQLTFAAFFYHPSLDVARAQWAVATAGRKTAAGRLNPTVGVTPGYNFSAASGISPWFPGFSFDVPIETAGKRAKRMKRAGHLAESARLNIATAAWQVRAALRAALIEAATASRRRELLQAQVDAQRLMVQLLEQRLNVGNVSALDVAVARLPLVKLQAEIADARRSEVGSRSRLAEALGVPVRAVAGLPFQYPPAPDGATAPASEDARRGALQHRADILSACAAYEASQANLQVEIARQYPDLHLGSGYQWDQGDNKWNLALTLDLPVLNRNQGPIAEAEARRREAAAQLLALQARVIAEIDRAFAALRASAEQLAGMRQVREALRERAKLVEARLGAGGADQLEVQAYRLLGEVGFAQHEVDRGLRHQEAPRSSGEVRWHARLVAVVRQDEQVHGAAGTVGGRSADHEMTRGQRNRRCGGAVGHHQRDE